MQFMRSVSVMQKFYGKAKERKPFDFVGKTGIFIAISCAIIVCGCVGVGMHKSSDGTILNYSLEFKGGTSTAVVMDKQYSIKEIDKEIVPLVEKITGDGNSTGTGSRGYQADHHQDPYAVTGRENKVRKDHDQEFWRG